VHTVNAAPSEVTRNVSGETSADTRPPSRAVTVRHTPLVARLSPIASSPTSADSISRRIPPAMGRRPRTIPTSSINPVNIGLQQHIRPERHGPHRPERGE